MLPLRKEKREYSVLDMYTANDEWSLKSLNTFLPSLGIKLLGLRRTFLALGGKIPVLQHSCKSAKPSFVPSAEGLYDDGAVPSGVDE